MDIVLSIIKNKLSQPPKNDLTKDYHIKEVDNGTAKKFLEKNHIEGFVKSYINIGLYHYEKLISLMTMKKGSEKCYEILRHCNEINEQFVEGIDALLNYFIDKFKPLKIVSFSDVRLPNDKLYKELGFKEIKYNNKPNYFYFKLNDYKRKRVRNIDSNDNIKKYLKIYDCGKKKYELDLR